MILRYPLPALLGDYARGALGFALTGGPVLFVDMARVLFWIFAVVAAVFAAFLVRTAIRHQTALRVDEVGVATSPPLAKTIPWDALAQVKLRYFSTRRDKENGWMQLILRGNGKTISAESMLTDFDRLAERVAEEALARGVELDDLSRSNFTGMGITLIVPPAEGDAVGERDWMAELREARARRQAARAEAAPAEDVGSTTADPSEPDPPESDPSETDPRESDPSASDAHPSTERPAQRRGEGA